MNDVSSTGSLALVQGRLGLLYLTALENASLLGRKLLETFCSAFVLHVAFYLCSVLLVYYERRVGRIRKNVLSILLSIAQYSTQLKLLSMQYF